MKESYGGGFSLFVRIPCGSCLVLSVYLTKKYYYIIFLGDGERVQWQMFILVSY